MKQNQRGPQARRRADQRPGNSPPRWYRFAPNRVEETTVDPFARDVRMAKLEAALFLAQEPVTIRKLVNVVGLKDAAEGRAMIQRLRELYDADGSAFQIHDVAGGYMLFTRPAFQPWLLRSNRGGNDPKLTPAMLETLAVIAQRQPIMRAEIEGIRGVGCGELLTQLMERGMIKIVGRHESLGRPILFGTTKKFLLQFGLNSIEDFQKHMSNEQE